MPIDVYAIAVAVQRKTKVVGYLRVSTDAQAEHGFGLEIQEAAIRDWARREGVVVVGLYTDAGVSGSNGLDGREGLPAAMAALRSGRAAGIVVYRLDRLARDLVLQETLLNEVRRMGCAVHSTTGGEAAYLADDPEDPSRRLIRQILGAVSEYERSLISLRLRSGRRSKAANGGFAYGSPPFGWESIDGTLVEVASEQQIIERMRSLHAGGRSVRGIAEDLNAEGVVAKRVGSRWHPTTVARVLSN
jgi:DNA invertase Pin-like site-specific DNA recombinase